jgi:hypothetical protein
VNRYAAWPTVVADGHDTLYMCESWLVRWHVFFISNFHDWKWRCQSRGRVVRRGPDRLKVGGDAITMAIFPRRSFRYKLLVPSSAYSSAQT